MGNIPSSWKEFTLSDKLDKYNFLIFIHSDSSILFSNETNTRMIPVSFILNHNAIFGIDDFSFDGIASLKKGTNADKVYLCTTSYSGDSKNVICLYAI